jgi:hypothetical protein
MTYRQTIQAIQKKNYRVAYSSQNSVPSTGTVQGRSTGFRNRIFFCPVQNVSLGCNKTNTILSPNQLEASIMRRAIEIISFEKHVRELPRLWWGVGDSYPGLFCLVPAITLVSLPSISIQEAEHKDTRQKWTNRHTTTIQPKEGSGKK